MFPIVLFTLKKKSDGKVFLTKMVFEGRGTTQQKKVRFFWRIFLPVGPDNRFKVFRRKTYLSRRDRLENLPGIPSLPFSAFFCPFFFFLKKAMKKDEKGWDRKGLWDRLGYQVRKNTIKPSFSSGIRRRDTRILSTDKDNTIKKK